MTKFSLNFLFYGDHLRLTTRCLGSVYPSLGEGARYLKDIRIGLNAVHWATDVFVVNWASRVFQTYGIPTILYRPEKNVCKYPIMRRMFHDRNAPLADWAMWFDDDSYLQYTDGWWSRLAKKTENADVLGYTNWYMPVRGRRWQWVQQQPWFTGNVGLPPQVPQFKHARCFRFTQGAWWVVKRAVVRRFDWPIRELNHCGGDSIFGELCRQQRLRTVAFHEGVRINADLEGKPCRGKRRGHDEVDLGTDPIDEAAPDLSHHDFALHKTVIGDLSTEAEKAIH